jgi:hypothetical protein
MENPFKYGGVVEGDFFADRVEELDELTREMRALNRVFLVSERRLGKTCLLFNLMARLRKEGLSVAYLDLNACPDLPSLAVTLTQAASRAVESNMEKLLKIFSGLKRLRPKVSVGADGSLSAGVEVAADSGEGLIALLEGMRNAEELAKRKGKRLTVVIDEFSDLPKFNGGTLEKALRSEIQLHSSIGYIFSGSEHSVMLAMCRDQKRAFYKMGRIMELGPIPRAAYGDFIKGWMEQGGYKVGLEDLDHLFTLGEDIPYNIQRMCNVLWERAGNTHEITRDTIDGLPFIIAKQDSAHFELVWQSVSQQQKTLLMALAREPGAKPFSRDFQLKYGIGPSSSIKASLESLVRKGVLSRSRSGAYKFSDTFMRYWILGLIERGT